MNGLKPCPFCGGKVVMTESIADKLYTHESYTCCGCYMDFSYTRCIPDDYATKGRTFAEVFNSRVVDGDSHE